MDRIKQGFLERQELQPLWCLRYIDDIFFIWTHAKEELKKFMETLITLHLNLVLRMSPVKNLDLIITILKQKVKTTLHTKSTDRHQCLHYASSHSEHTKRSIVLSLTFRIRLCSEVNDFKNYRSQMKSWFLEREYPEKLIENERRKIKFCKEGIKKAKGVQGTRFVVTYHLQLKNLGRIIN